MVISGETSIDFTAKWDGHETTVRGNPGFNQIELRRIDKNQAEAQREEGWSRCGDGSRQTFH